MVAEIPPSEAFTAVRFAADGVRNLEQRRALREESSCGLRTPEFHSVPNRGFSSLQARSSGLSALLYSIHC